MTQQQYNTHADSAPFPTDKREVARKYYEDHGFAVVPILPRGKRPPVKWNESDLPTADACADRIDGWWDQYPNCDVGILTGERSDGLVVLDEDDRDALDASGFGIPDTGWVARTPSGGRHFYYRSNTPVKNGQRVAPGLDVRGEGGLVAAPPAEGRDWIRRDPDGPAVLPADLAKQWAAAPRAEVVPDHQRPPKYREGEHGIPQAVEELEERAERIRTTPKGERNDTLYREASRVFQLVRAGELDRKAARNELQDAGETAGLSASEAEAALRSAEGSDLAKKARSALAPQQGEDADLLRALAGKNPSQADLLVVLAEDRYDFGRASDGEYYALPRNGPKVATMLSGGRHSLRAELAAAFHRTFRKTPRQAALKDAMTVLRGKAKAQPAEDMAVRTGEHDGAVYVDLADPTGRAIRLDASGWHIVQEPPILFRRSALMAPLPEPQRGGGLEELRDLLNVSDRDWPLVVGWLVAALLPGLHHPILSLEGEQGTGKSSQARMLVQVVDPQPSPLRSPPRNENDWAVAAGSSWVVTLDNVSRVQPWFSDALCRAVTGQAYVTRKLYEDKESSVIRIQRCIMLTSIDLGAIRGDLADRMVRVELERINPRQRRSETELRRHYEAARPRVTGALLTLAAKVLEALPRVDVNDLPRMADFGRVLAALDDVTGLGALDAYTAQAKDLEADVIASDPVAQAVYSFAYNKRSQRWEGTAGELLDALKMQADAMDPPKWLRELNPRGLTAALKRNAPALRANGVEVNKPYPSGPGEGRSRRNRLWRIEYRQAGEPA